MNQIQEEKTKKAYFHIDDAELFARFKGAAGFRGETMKKAFTQFMISYVQETFKPEKLVAGPYDMKIKIDN